MLAAALLALCALTFTQLMPRVLTFRTNSRALVRYSHHRRVSQVEDDGYSLSKRPWKDFISQINPFKSRQPGTLILVRHGETTLNYNKTFTGWIDVDLSDRGKIEVFLASYRVVVVFRKLFFSIL
jgi:hypothetical protein